MENSFTCSHLALRSDLKYKQEVNSADTFWRSIHVGLREASSEGRLEVSRDLTDYSPVVFVIAEMSAGCASWT